MVKKIFTSIFNFSNRRVCVKGFTDGSILLRIKKEDWIEFNYSNFKKYSHKFTLLETDMINTLIENHYLKGGRHSSQD